MQARSRPAPLLTDDMPICRAAAKRNSASAALPGAGGLAARRQRVSELSDLMLDHSVTSADRALLKISLLACAAASALAASAAVACA